LKRIKNECFTINYNNEYEITDKNNKYNIKYIKPKEKKIIIYTDLNKEEFVDKLVKLKK